MYNRKSSWQIMDTSTAIVSTIAYSFCSISMVLVNKTLLSRYRYPYSFTMLAIQGAIAVAWILLANKLGRIKLSPLSSTVARKWLPVNLLFIAMLYTSFRSLQSLAVPLVTIFKNLTNMAILYGEWVIFGQRCSRMVIASMGIVLTGALLAGWTDIHFNPSGYVWMLINCSATAAYVLYMRAIVQIDLSNHEKALYNNLLMVPIASFLALCSGEWPHAFLGVGSVEIQKTDVSLSNPEDTFQTISVEWWSSPGFWLSVIFSGSVGFLLNLASLWCVACTSGSTYSMVGALNKIPLVVLGVLLFREPVTLSTSIFILLSLLGGFLYAYAKNLERQQKISAAPSASKSTLLPFYKSQNYQALHGENKQNTNRQFQINPPVSSVSNVSGTSPFHQTPATDVDTRFDRTQRHPEQYSRERRPRMIGEMLKV